MNIFTICKTKFSTHVTLVSAALALALSTSALAATSFTPSDNKNLAVVYTLDKPIEEDFFKFTKDDMKKIGFFLNDPHHNVQNVYVEQVGATGLEQLSFSSMVNDMSTRPLMNIDPRLGGFTPFNLVIYRKKSEPSKTIITHIVPEAALDILGISDTTVRTKFVDMFKPMNEAIEKKYGAKKSYVKLQGYAKESMMNFEIPFEEPEDVDDFFDKFQEKFESSFQAKGYIIAGFYNMKYSLNTKPDQLPGFDEYVVWSLCHIPFSYTIFDGKNPLPQAAIFAPCSMYAYIKKGENKIVIGMPTLHAWASALGITEKDKLEKIDQLDTEIPAVIESLGGKRVPNTNPLVK